jgi:hypothetical protein
MMSYLRRASMPMMLKAKIEQVPKNVWILVAVVLTLLLLAVAVYYYYNYNAGRGTPWASTYAPPKWSVVTDPNALRLHCGSYFRGFSPCDLAARRCESASQCIDAYLASLRLDVAQEVIDRIGKAVAAADRALTRAGRNMPAPRWRIAVLDDRAESGFPHTHGDIVCMPASFFAQSFDERKLVRTLVHERVHVLQRAHPEAFFDAIAESSAGRVALSSLGPKSDVLLRRRSNPDLDRYMYVDAETGLATAMLFDGVREAAEGGLGAARLAWIEPMTGNRASFDTKAEKPAYEHPHERLAYEIADLAVPPDE